MAFVYLRSGQSIYQACWTDTLTGKRIYRSTKTTHKRKAQRLADAWERDAQVTRPKTLHALSQLWLDELKSLGRSTKHLTQRARALETLGLDVLAANRMLGERAKDGTWSDRTIDTYHGALKQFGRWCFTNGHRDRDPMAGLRKPSRRTGRVYVRGVLTEEQAQRLCSCPFLPSSRRLVYRTALCTGLRIGELRKLKPENLVLRSGKPCIHLAPSQVKNRFESIIPIDHDLFSSLQSGLDLSSFHKAGLRLRRDLVIAGLPTEDSDGHVIDFHSLRATFGDMLIKKGVSIPAVARLMRHKDGGGLLLKKYTQGFEEEGLTITMK